jgi:exodeoxyribonuclease VII large subunit
VLADPLRGLETRHVEVERLRDAARSCVERGLDRRAADVAHLVARLTTLGPAATLARGYAVVQRVPPGHAVGMPLPVLRSTGEAPAGTRLRVRVADGAVGAVVAGGVETDAP